VVGLLKLVYPASNEFLVESKSLKLYLNSFNMEQYGNTREEGIVLATGIIRRDLSELLKCDVQVTCFDHHAPKTTSDFEDYSLLEEIVDFDSLSCTEYKEYPALLRESATPGEIRWGTHLLRSNCKITHQPDWGTLYMAMKGEKLPTPESFLQYIVSLRNENHFHEEICEMVFQRINTRFRPELLMVTCLYTRRGGIDICPVRTSGMPLPENLTNVNASDKLAFRQ
jgi:7-cyano-7-deazaguanine reductase